MAEALTFSRPLDGLRRTALRLRARARGLVRAYPREAIGVGVLGFVAAVAVGSMAVPNAATNPPAHAAPPSPPAMTYQQVAPQQALAINAEIPLSSGPNPAAAPFLFNGSASARTQALQCLASAVYYEAGNQDEDGQRAVAQVVLNRVRHPAFPNSICGVVYQGSTRATGCQFTFTCDGSLSREPDADGWRRAYKIAEDALSGAVFAPVGWATHYHANYVVPTWASNMAKDAIVGAQLFYRWPGSWGRPAIFTQAYAGHEPSASALRLAALAAPHVVPATRQGDVAEAVRDIPGAEALKLAPSMRGDKRVAVRFNLVARKASADVVPEDYTKKFEASDNLKYALSAEPVGENEQPLGRSSGSSGAGAERGAALASAQH